MMLSTYLITGMICGFFLWIMAFKKFHAAHISFIWLFAIHLLTRLFIVRTIEIVPDVIWINFLFDEGSFLVFYLWMRTMEEKEKRHNVFLFLIFCPLDFLAVVSGKLLFMGIWLAALLCLAALLGEEEKSGKAWNFFVLFREYVGFCYGILLYVIATKVYNQKPKQCIAMTEEAPTLLILSYILIVFSVGTALWKIKSGAVANEGVCQTEGEVLSGQDGKQAEEQEEKQNEKQDERPGQAARMNWKNYLVLLGMTVVYAFLIFYRIGSTQAPQSFLKLSTPDENTIHLDFGKNIRITKMQIYLGYQSKRSFTVLFQKQDDPTWFKLEGEQLVESPFCWNSVWIDIGEASRYLELTTEDKEAYLHEIVFLDEEGERVLPVNAADYPELFDEQELYPEYATYYYRTMFDEVYHGRTAYELVHDLPLYEITHPPLGKLLMSVGVRIFGMTPLGWRFSSAVLGILLVPLLYVFAWKLWHDRWMAFFCTALHGMGFMHFTLSRIATIDIHVAFFVMLMFLFMLGFLQQWLGSQENRKKELLWLFFCGVSTGCAIATKWTGFYAAVGLAVLLIMALVYRLRTREWNRKEKGHLWMLFLACVVFFVVIPLLIYCLSYFPYLSRNPGKGLLSVVMENMQYMLTYHNGVKKAHPFESQWYEWLIDKRPLWDAVTWFEDGRISSISTFGNPLILWGGLAAFLYNVYLVFQKKEKRALFLCMAYLSMLVPWFFVHRTVFIYQYFISTIFLVLLLGNMFAHRKRRREMYGFLLLAVLLFCVFYPQLSGMTVSMDYTKRVLQWLPTWKFT